jgi:hypothetical protein
VLLKSVSDLLLSFLDGSEPGVKTSMLHLLLMIYHGAVDDGPCDGLAHCGVVIEAMSR